MKRWFNKIVCITLMLFTLLTGGCFKKDNSVGTGGYGCYKVKLYEFGDFLITKDNEIYDFSEQGLNKEYIVIPETINGVKVMTYRKGRGDHNSVRFTYSDKIKKIYNAQLVSDYSFLNYSEENKNVYITYNNQQKILETQKCKMLGLEYDYDRDSYMSENFILASGVEREFLKKSNNHIPMAKIKQKDFDTKGVLEKCYSIADIEFLYNYEGAPNNGIYWLDDLETGEKLSYMPENPLRDGYMFGGWYADSECTTFYDFSLPYIKNEKYVRVSITDYYFLCYPKDYATKIYAKWIEV